MTLREERAAFERLRLIPRVLRGVSSADPRITVLGTPVSMPVLVAPMGLHGMVHPEGEYATAWGLAVDGAAGVRRVLKLLRDELAVVLAGPISGASTPASSVWSRERRRLRGLRASNRRRRSASVVGPL